MRIKYSIPEDVELTKDHLLVTKKEVNRIRAGYYLAGAAVGALCVILVQAANKTDDTTNED